MKQRIKKLSSIIASLENLLLEVTGDYYGEYIDIADDKVKYDIIVIKMDTINRIDKAMVVITMVDNETKYLLDTRNHKIFTKFTPDLKGLAPFYK